MCRQGARRNPTKYIRRLRNPYHNNDALLWFQFTNSTGATLAIVSESSEEVKGGCGGKGDRGDLRLGCGKARFAVEQELQPLPA